MKKKLKSIQQFCIGSLGVLLVALSSCSINIPEPNVRTVPGAGWGGITVQVDDVESVLAFVEYIGAYEAKVNPESDKLMFQAKCQEQGNDFVGLFQMPNSNTLEYVCTLSEPSLKSLETACEIWGLYTLATNLKEKWFMCSLAKGDTA